jgi:hypothetical protein
MTIERVKGVRTMMCDERGCGNFLEEEEPRDFEEFVAAARAAGWETLKSEGAWVHRCPDCREKE